MNSDIWVWLTSYSHRLADENILRVNILQVYSLRLLLFFKIKHSIKFRATWLRISADMTLIPGDLTDYPKTTLLWKRFLLYRVRHSNDERSWFNIQRLQRCGDIHLNEGRIKFPRRECEKSVRNNQNAIICSDVAHGFTQSAATCRYRLLNIFLNDQQSKGLYAKFSTEIWGLIFPWGWRNNNYWRKLCK